MSEFSTFPIDSIYFNRADRQRSDIGDLTDLKTSITQIGLINPIVITRDGELIAGERRLTSIKELGWTHAPVQFREDLDELEREQLELDENIKRRDYSWQEKCKATQKYFQLGKKLHGKQWTHELCADRLGMNERTVRKFLALADEIDNGNDNIASQPLMSTAANILARAHARAQDVEEEKLDNLIRPPTVLDPKQLPTPSLVPIGRKEGEETYPLINIAFEEWVRTNTIKFNLIHCDFPYGVQADKHNRGKAKTHGGYEDNLDTFLDLINIFEDYMDKFVARSAHLCFWFSIQHYELTRSRLEKMGWKVNPFPLIWHKTDNVGIVPDHRRMPRQIYETAFLCSIGDRFLVKPRANTFGGASSKEFHMSEKPVPMLEHFLSMLVDETTTMLDPTCGSGNALIVAQKLGAIKVLGLDNNADFIKEAQRNWKLNARKGD